MSSRCADLQNHSVLEHPTVPACPAAPCPPLGCGDLAGEVKDGGEVSASLTFPIMPASMLEIIICWREF